MDPASARRAEDQLNRVLGFFPRVEAKAATIFAVDAGMLGLMCLNMRPGDVGNWHIIVPAGFATLLILVSLWSVYRCMFPLLRQHLHVRWAHSSFGRSSWGRLR